MGTAQMAWLKSARISLQDMTEAIKLIRNTSQPPGIPANHQFQHTPTISDLVQNVQRLRKACLRTGSEGIRLCPESTSPDSQQTDLGSRSQYALLVTDYTHFLTALVPQLGILGCQLNSTIACSVGTAEEALFWELWALLSSSSSMFLWAGSTSPSLVLADSRPLYIAFYAALYKLMSWLLRMSRSAVWRCMQQAHGLQTRNHDLSTLLSIPADCFRSLSVLPTPALISLLSCIPPAFLPTLACIVTEQFCNLPFWSLKRSCRRGWQQQLPMLRASNLCTRYSSSATCPTCCVPSQPQSSCCGSVVTQRRA